MQAEFLDRSIQNGQSIRVTDYRSAHFIDIWHYHSQIELVGIIESEGTRLVGDSIEPFQPGQLVILGPNIPHMWKNDPKYFDGTGRLSARAITVHLDCSFAENLQYLLPEFNSIRFLLDNSRRGILFRHAFSQIHAMLDFRRKSGFALALAVLEWMNGLAEQEKYDLMASPGYLQQSLEQGERLDKVRYFVINHFREDIGLPHAAEIAGMSPSSFSRFFSRTQGKSYIRYLNEVRVGYARKLLTDYNWGITDICYESGFRNISNFNRQFRLITGLTPSNYRAQFRR